MDGPTKPNVPEGDDPKSPPPDLPEKPGASGSEFTQYASRPDDRKHYEYAIPEEDSTIPTPATPRYDVPPNTIGGTLSATRPAEQRDYREQPGTDPNTRYIAPLAPGPIIPAAMPPRPPKPRQNWTCVALAVILFSTGIAASVGVFFVLQVITSHQIALQPTGTAVPLASNTPGTPAPTPTVGLGIEPWDGQHRLTILMMGIDKRPNDVGTTFRTDSMIVVSIDPATKNVGILSIPRDLFVDIPTDTVVTNPYGLQRVNAAYVIGELARPGYGPQLAMQTVQYNLGIRINNYAVYEFGSVISGIDLIGGIDVDVPYAISDPSYPDMYYGYDPLYIPAGHIHMDGALTLKYARTRHQTSDFDRAKRQQQIVLAARDKILNANMLPQLILQSPTIWAKLSQGIHSDLSLQQMLQLVVYLKDIPTGNIHQGIIDLNYVTGMMYNGQAILLPERAKLGPLLTQVFGANYNNS